MAALVDTNVLVYRFDGRDARKQKTAAGLLRRGIAEDSIFIAFQAVIEFHAAVTRPIKGLGPLLSLPHAVRETEELLAQFPILYPDERLVRTALRGLVTYQLSWFDAQMWAYAETNGINTILSEDFQHGRYYGTVQTVNPFAES